MTDAQQAVDSAIGEAERLRKVLGRVKSAQVRSAEYNQLIKATALSWFNSHRSTVHPAVGDDAIKPIDELYRAVLGATTRATTREKYLSWIKEIKRKLGTLQADHAVALSYVASPGTGSTSDTAPTFSPMISDPKMQQILTKRWNECCTCVSSNAPLAATVMMGGLLEGLLLAKINQLADKTPVFAASAVPKDKSGKTLQLKEWGLKNFIDVAHELGWIGQSAKDVGEVLRDYRNYIHPQKELSHGLSLEPRDARMLWEVAKSIALQILRP